MLEISGIRKHYRKKQVLQDVSFQVKPGACVGIVGGNGSGKTTLLSILAGAIKPDAGTVRYLGTDVTRSQKFYSSEIAYVPQENPIMEELSVKDNLKLWYKDFKKVENSSSVEEPYVILGLQSVLSLPAGKLSGGMKKRLSIACALSNHGSILILDEPGAALDLVCKEEIRNYLIRYQNQGGMIVLTSHEMEELSLCSQMYALRQGRLEAISTELSAKDLMACLI
ncbi:heme ABC exporter ATP-binding protein CcmA [Lacrimispora sp.]|uniref:heme ABC exporter ATP-binding protein CcmA n=1 Tax=Lacrimispora sp. TaxID=2719234 RepID=UPI00289C37F5|nr:heme ABC exporter ATP-binding protein CcmA [Lacrimispora sp.]